MYFSWSTFLTNGRILSTNLPIICPQSPGRILLRTLSNNKLKPDRSDRKYQRRLTHKTGKTILMSAAIRAAKCYFCTFATLSFWGNFLLNMLHKVSSLKIFELFPSLIFNIGISQDQISVWLNQPQFLCPNTAERISQTERVPFRYFLEDFDRKRAGRYWDLYSVYLFNHQDVIFCYLFFIKYQTTNKHSSLVLWFSNFLFFHFLCKLVNSLK